MNTELGENLIFIISSRRSGSTLLQHILCAHSELGGIGEPYIMLPLLYALRNQGHEAEYVANIAYTGLNTLLSTLPEGKERYYIAARNMALQLYNRFLEEHGKTKFVDKSTRYYLVIPELVRVFPKAKYVFLFRNPLAVLASVLSPSIQGDWTQLAQVHFRNDLLQCPASMIEGIDLLGKEAITVNYEKLVEAPEKVVPSLCKRLEISYEPEMIHYGSKPPLPGLKDPKSVNRHHEPVSDYVNQWVDFLNTPRRLNFAEGYLCHLRPDLVRRMGYSYDELSEIIINRKNKKNRIRYVIVSWDILMDTKQKKTCMDSLRLTVGKVMHRIEQYCDWFRDQRLSHGWRYAIRYSGYKIKKSLFVKQRKDSLQ